MSLPFELLNTYIFSGKFPIPIPSLEVNRSRVVFLDFDVYRPAKSPFFSNKTNPPTGFLATACILSQGYVIERRDIVFDKQRIYLQGSTDDQIIYALRCYDAINARRQEAMVSALGGGVILGVNPFSTSLRSLGIFPTEVRVVAYADVALSVKVYNQNVLECPGDFPAPTPDPQLPPLVPPPLPISAGVAISPSLYSPLPGGLNPSDYEPFPLDSAVTDPPAIGNECSVYTVVYSFVDNGVVRQDSRRFYGAIGRIFRVENSPGGRSELFLESRGFVDFAPGTCQGFFPVSIERSGNLGQFLDPQIVSITPG